MSSEVMMCLICADIDNGKINAIEARRNLGEMYVSMEKKHILETLKKIWSLEDSENMEDDEEQN
tara:strand:- start:13079 stop:13270 length:192 start_codon:yes stop_codon:yes gene_type:complete